jgi:methyl-accepting chemotaxis protein
MLSNMTIKARLILLVSVIMVVSAVVMTSAFMGISNLQSASEDIVVRRIHLIRSVNKLMYDMADTRAQLMRGMQHDPANPASKLHDHPISKHLDAIVDNQSKIEGYFAALDKDTRSEDSRRILKEFRDSYATFVSEGLLLGVQAVKDGKFEDAGALLSKKVNPLLDLAMEKGHAVAERQNDLAKQNYENAMTAALRSEMMLVAGALLMLAVGVGLGYSVISSVSNSTGELRDAMIRMGQDGDLSRRITVHGNDELAHAATAFNGLIDNFSNIIRQVSSSAGQVSNTTVSLSSASMQISRGSQAQSEAAASTAAAVEEITVSISSVANNTEEVRKLSEKSLRQTQQGNQNVTAMIGEIGRVQDAVQQIAGSVKEFVDSTRAIAGMTQQVKDIADQTNLLALNAAIEAARAGEQGRGFAVVADEVRKLAEKSAQSANEIDRVTNALNQKSTHVEATLLMGLRSLQTTQEQVERVSAVLTEAGESVAQSSHGVSDIAASVGEQSQASNAIARNVEKIAQMSEENHAAVSSNTQDLAHLEQLARELQTAVSRFRV